MMTQNAAAIKGGLVHAGLQHYVHQRDEVAGWVTDQAVVLKDGSMRSTEYLQYGSSGMILRSALGPFHPESEPGLRARFEKGERYVPLTESGLAVVNHIIAYDDVVRENREYEAVALAIANPDSMPRWVFEKLQTIGESMDRDYAAGQDAVDGFDEKHAEVGRLLDASPYQMHPDHGCVLNADVARLDAQATQSRESAAEALAVLQVLESIKQHFVEAASAWSSLPPERRAREPFAPSPEAALEGSINHGLKAVTALVDDLLVESTKDANAISDLSA